MGGDLPYDFWSGRTNFICLSRRSLVVKHCLGKTETMGPIPIDGSRYADVAQVVEQHFRKVWVDSASLSIGSKINLERIYFAM